VDCWQGVQVGNIGTGTDGVLDGFLLLEDCWGVVNQE
jgi:hypothetical protein